MPLIRYWTSHTGMVVEEWPDPLPPEIKIPIAHPLMWRRAFDPTRAAFHTISKMKAEPPPYPPYHDYF